MSNLLAEAINCDDPDRAAGEVLLPNDMAR
jgi:hypothetical protein